MSRLKYNVSSRPREPLPNCTCLTCERPSAKREYHSRRTHAILRSPFLLGSIPLAGYTQPGGLSDETKLLENRNLDVIVLN